MNNKWKRIISICLVVLFVFSLAACGSKSSEPKATDTAAADKSQSSGPEELKLPIAKGDIELSIYIFFPDGARQVYQSLADNPVVKEMSKQTGLKFKFIHPPQNDDGTFFNMTIASGNLPDLFMVQNGFKTYPGGPEGAIADGVLVNMNDLINKYAPDFLRMVKEQGPVVEKRIKSDNGTYTGFGTIMQPPFLNGRVHAGLVARTDILKELNLEAPETIDEYTKVLKAMKDSKKVAVPLTLPKLDDDMWQQYNVISSAFGVTEGCGAKSDFYVNNGKVVYSKIQPAYKDFLALMNSWYKDGLIDKDFLTKNRNDSKKLLQNGTAGMGLIGNYEINTILKLGQEINPKFDILGMPYPKKNKGDALHLSEQMISVNDRAWFLSKSCKNPVEAIKFVDYLYLKDTQLMTAWGLGTKEYPTFEIKDGKRVFTDFMKNNKDFDFTIGRDRFTANPFQIMWEEEMEKQSYDSVRHIPSWDAWKKGNDNADRLPFVLTMTPEESREYIAIINPITTYTNEMVAKIIVGQEPISKFDEYVAKAKSMNLDTATKHQQTAYDRYLKR